MLSTPNTPRVRFGRSAGIVLAMLAVVAGTIYFGRVIRGPLTASQLGASVPSFTPVVARETTFPQPQRVEWTGVIEGILAGGQGFAVRRTDTGERFQAYLAADARSSVSEGPVRITGVVTGISCAYAETVFGGACTQSVDIESLEQLPVMLIQ